MTEQAAQRGMGVMDSSMVEVEFDAGEMRGYSRS